MIHTREEAIARAKAWLDKVGSARTTIWSEIYNHEYNRLLPWAEAVFHKQGDGGGMGGFVIVLERGGSDQGTALAVEEYSADTKKFHWREPEED